MALAAIEAYNKPTFPGREQVFCILIVNAWESLAKAKILRDSRNNMRSLRVKEGRRYKKTGAGEYWTINVLTAIGRCPVEEVVKTNVEKLVEVRNAATHLTADSPTLPLLVYNLGAASLANYAHLLAKWFDIRLNQYHFYILPLGFSYPFTTLSAADSSKDPKDVSNILNSVIDIEKQGLDRDGLFFTCKLEIALISAKKATSDPDLVARIDPDGEASVIRRNVSILDRYPYSYTEATDKICALNPDINRYHINGFIREQNIKDDERYAAYNYRNKAQRARGSSSGTPVVYNDDFIRLCVASIQPEPRPPTTAF